MSTNPLHNESGLRVNVSKAENSIYLVSGWELELDTLNFHLDSLHKEMLSALGYEDVPDSLPLLEYAERYIYREDIALVQDRVQYAISEQDNPEYADRLEVRLKDINGVIHYYLVNIWRLRRGMIKGQGQNISDLKHTRELLIDQASSLKAVIENTDDVIFIVKCGGELVMYNENFSGLMKAVFSLECYEGMNLISAVPESFSQRWIPLLNEGCMGKKASHEMALELCEIIHVEVAVNPIFKEEVVTGVSFFVRDITNKWRMSAWESLETRVLEQAYKSSSISEVCDTLLLGIQEICPQMTCYITRKKPDAMALEWLSSPSLPLSYTGLVAEIPIDPANGSCGLSSSSMKPALVSNIMEHRSWDIYRDVTILNGFYACYSIPVISREGKIMGTLGAYFREVHECTDFEMSLWLKAVNLVGILMDKELTEAENRKRSKQLDEISTSIPGVLYLIKMDKSGKRTFEYISKKASEYINQPVESFNGDYDSILDMMLPEYRASLQEVLEKSLREKSQVDFEFTLRPEFNPEFHRYKLVASHDFKDDGTIYTYGTIIDITTQRRNEMALQEKSQEMIALINCIDDIVCVMDREGHYIEVFARDESKFMYPKDQLIGRKLDELMPKNIVEGYYTAVRELDEANSNSSSEFYYELTFNEVVSFYKARVLKIDENSRYLVTIHDVTEERQVIEVNNKLRRILEEAGEYSQFGSFEFNVNTQQVLWSDQLKQVLGVPADFNEDKLFEYYLSSIHPDDVAMMTSLIEMASSKNEDFDVEHRFRHFDGHYIWLRCAARCSTDPFSGHQLIQGISMDITQMKEAEEREKRKHSLMEAVSILSLKLASEQELEATVNNMMQKIGETTGVSRVFLFKNGQHPVSGEPTVTQILEWTDAVTPPQQGDPVLDDLNVSLLGFERWAEMLNAGVPVVGNVADFPGAEQAYLTDNGIKSVLVVPISLNGEWWGSLGFDECRHEREWTDDEVMLLTAVANLIGTVIERRKVHEKIAESEMRYRTAVETMTEGLIISDVNGVHRFANESAAKILDVPLEFLIGTGPELANENMRLLHPDGSDYDFSEYPCMVTLRKQEVIYDIVMGFAFTGQPVKWISINSCPLYSGDSKDLTGVLMTFSDITERINYESQMKSNLAQKELLLTEIHHRVKNNLAIISSLLQLQQLYTQDEQIKTMLMESQGRLRSMSLVHEILYRNGDFSKVSFSKYLSEIGEYVQATFAKPEQDIMFEISTDNCELEITKAIPCGLIVNELITNAFKYAFNGRNGGIIVISMKEQGDYYVLEICDDGPGLPSGINWSESKTMGFTLVRTLSTQLKGALTVENKNGARVVLTFPK